MVFIGSGLYFMLLHGVLWRVWFGPHLLGITMADELALNLVLWTPKYGQRKQGRPALTYIDVLTADELDTCVQITPSLNFCLSL